ncbi:MAG: 50S ribosomal protein L29 [Blastochloris sp.]|jgi:large subunit ribosomal protein L29|nr:50S ribosomal protein L29 [Blastochloris sp.]
MKNAEVIILSDQELLTKVQDLKQERLNLRIQQQSGQLERPSRLKEIRKTIARIETAASARRIKTSVKAS